MKKDSKAILTDMTVDEKISLACGHDFWKTNAIERLGIPQVMMCDGPHGLRKQKGQGDHLGINESIETVCYPSASALAASFDTELMEKLGETLGEGAAEMARRMMLEMPLGALTTFGGVPREQLEGMIAMLNS